MTPSREKRYRAGLFAALIAGEAVLRKGGSALDAVEAAVVCLENDPVFNAGRGAALTLDGTAELDAAIMDGATLRAGAVTQIRRIGNPIKLARTVLERSCHVFLAGEGAERFAKDQGFAFASPDVFVTEHRMRQLKEVRARAGKGGGFGTQAKPKPALMEEPPVGTVGAVALDKKGNLAAATSTGGMTAKHPGRVGDSPVIGAGTYADNRTCAVSATGHGEWFIRTVVAHDVAARIDYLGNALDTAAGDVIARLKEFGGAGGLIAVDAKGTISMPFNTSGMYRGCVKSGEAPRAWIF